MLDMIYISSPQVREELGFTSLKADQLVQGMELKKDKEKEKFERHVFIKHVLYTNFCLREVIVLD